MKCSNCGKELSPTAKFCNGCGTAVEVKHYEIEDSHEDLGTSGSIGQNQSEKESKMVGSDKKKIFILAGLMVIALVGGLVVKGMGGKEKQDNARPVKSF